MNLNVSRKKTYTNLNTGEKMMKNGINIWNGLKIMNTTLRDQRHLAKGRLGSNYSSQPTAYGGS